MRRDDANRLARAILRDLVRRDQAHAGSGFLSYKLLRRLAVHATLMGTRLERHLTGPWEVSRLLPIGARFGAAEQSTARCGNFHLPVPSDIEAATIVALLNWCQVPEPAAV